MLNETHTEESQESQSRFDFDSGSQLVNVSEPSSPSGLDDLIDDAHNYEKKSSSPVPSSQRPSDGQLNQSFKFGGLPCRQSSMSLAKDDKQPLTLSDITPPSSHVRSLSNSTTTTRF
jgi:serine/arginine repetitive matrix protein 2